MFIFSFHIQTIHILDFYVFIRSFIHSFIFSFIHSSCPLQSDKLTLCDCPGLVLPSFVGSRADMVCNGVLPIDQMSDYVSPVVLVCQRIPLEFILEKYGLTQVKVCTVRCSLFLGSRFRFIVPFSFPHLSLDFVFFLIDFSPDTCPTIFVLSFTLLTSSPHILSSHPLLTSSHHNHPPHPSPRPPTGWVSTTRTRRGCSAPSPHREGSSPHTVSRT